MDHLDLTRSYQSINETPHQFKHYEQFASLVHLLRKSKEENAQLKSELAREQERLKEKLREETQTREELKRVQEMLDMCKRDNEALKLKLESNQAEQHSFVTQNLIDFK